MRTFEVKIEKDRTEKETSFTWPAWWNEVKEKVDIVAYEDNPKALGKRAEGAVCICDETTWALIALKRDAAITLLSEIEANERGRQWRPQVTRITNQDAVLIATAQVASGGVLTAAQKRALDPDDPTPGVGKSKLFDVRQICRGKGGDLNESRR